MTNRIDFDQANRDSDKRLGLGQYADTRHHLQKLCLGCGIARDIVAFADGGEICHGCAFERSENSAIWLRQKLDCHRFYEGPALYAVTFPIGTKFGRARLMCKRIQDYQAVWCHPIIAISGIAMPTDLLISAERSMLLWITSKVDKMTGEFAHSADSKFAVKAFEYICEVYFDRLSLYSQNWRNQ